MLRPFTPTRCLVFLACVSCLLIFTLVPRYDLLSASESHQIAPRDLILGPGPGGNEGGGGGNGSSGGSGASSASSAGQSSTSSSQQTTSSGGSSSTSSASPAQSPSQNQPSSTSNSNSASQTSASSTSSGPPSGPSNTGNSNTPPPSPTSASSVVLSSLSTNDEGEVETVVITVPASAVSSSSSTSASAGADQSDDDSSKGVSTSTIIGLSVAGGIAFIGIAAFIAWKFTRKRFTDDFDDGEAIKWPELNAHGENPHTLPTQRADNAGFETNSQVNLTRPDSRAGSYAPSAAASAVDLYAPNAAQDPYAVPPLPHLNPNQPYRDDPSGGFYDPYSGPVPQAFSDGDNVSIAGGEAIPMTQIGRARSPAPPMGYDAGRRSPGPQMAYDAGRRSPGPQAAYLTDQTGRSSPSPRTMSPGPAMALSGRASPGPQAAYGYGGGAPPGLHPGY